jgi:hypothetical protein
MRSDITFKSLAHKLRGRVTATQHRKRIGNEFWGKPLNFVRGVFDLQVRRKRQALAAVAVILMGIMDIE